MEAFSERLKQAMAFRNFRQVDLVNATKIEKGTISNYLNGKYKPKGPNTYLIAKALNVNALWLLGYDVPMEIDQYVEYSEPNESDEGYLEIEYSKDIGDLTKEKWNEYYDMMVSLPETQRVEILKFIELANSLYKMQKKYEKE